MEHLFQQKVINANNLFDDNYIVSKALYLHCFNALPSITNVFNIDGEKAFTAVKENFAGRIQQIFAKLDYSNAGKHRDFERTVVVLDNACMLEFDSWYCEILHNGEQAAFVNEVVGLITKYKEPRRRKPLEINLIVQNRGNLSLKALEIKKRKTQPRFVLRR